MKKLYKKIKNHLCKHKRLSIDRYLHKLLLNGEIDITRKIVPLKTTDTVDYIISKYYVCKDCNKKLALIKIKQKGVNVMDFYNI